MSKMLLSRVRGSLGAAVVGDCIGEMYEGSGFVAIKTVVQYVNDIEEKWSKQREAGDEGKTKVVTPQLKFTDDTAMARSVAASLVEHKSVSVQDIASRFAMEYAREPFRGYGGNVITVLHALRDPNLTDIFQPARDQFNGSGSYGNGGGMRISPLGLFFYQQPLDDLKENTMKITRLTHSHRYGVVGALLQSFAVHLSLSLDNSKPLDAGDFLHQLLQRLRPVEQEVYRTHRQAQKGDSAEEKADDESEEEKLPYCDKLELIKEFLTRDVPMEEVDERLGTNISALDSVPTAVYCFLKGASKSLPGLEGRSEVEQTIMYAISLGGDTDTIATMAAAISGAFYGLESVPQAWLESCEGVTDAIAYADKMVEFFTECGRS